MVMATLYFAFAMQKQKHHEQQRHISSTKMIHDRMTIAIVALEELPPSVASLLVAFCGIPICM